MQPLLFALAVLLAVPAAAQETEPDTTDWHSYYPLDVGNEWQHRLERHGYPDEYSAVRITGETEVDGEAYYLAEACVTRNEYGEAPECYGASLIRYEEEHAAVVRRRVVDGEVQFESWLFPCRLDPPFFEGPQELECFDGTQTSLSVFGQYGFSVDIEGDEATGTRKGFSGGFDSYTFLSGVGLVLVYYEGGPEEAIIFARIGVVEYGERALNVGTEAAAPPEVRALSVVPNPLRETARLGFVLDRPEALILTVFDVRGRRVRTVDLGARGAGAHEVPFDAADLPPGAYQLRLRGGGFTATRGVIVLP